MRNEKVKMTIRRHPVYVAFKIALSGIVLLGSMYFVLIMDPDPGLIGSALELALFILGIISALAIIAFLYIYWNDTWVITDQRLIDSARNHPFHHHVNTINLEKVQDVSVSIDGILPTILGFGYVRCRTAGTDSSFVFEGVPEPRKVAEAINKHISVPQQHP